VISLLIETSSERGSICLFKENKILYQKALPFGFQNSKNLFPEIASAFNESHLEPSSLGLVMSGIGPGSYTGMRISAMAAKAISFSLKIPLVGVCSLDGFVAEEEGLFASVIDAKTGGVYMQTAFLEKEKVTLLREPTLYSLEAALPILREVKTIVTPNSRLLKPKFERLGFKGNFVEKDPDPGFMGASGFLKYKQGKFSLNGELELLYLRRSLL